MNFKEGEVLYFDKPLGWTSFKVVGHARYHICRRIKVKKLKVGHAGTLDPLATGVMIVCTGKATNRIEEFQYHTKEYFATCCTCLPLMDSISMYSQPISHANHIWLSIIVNAVVKIFLDPFFNLFRV